MRITPGPIVTDLSGALGDCQAYTRRGSHILKRKNIPAQPNTTAQQNRRNVFKFLTWLAPSIDWLTDPVWANYAREHKSIALAAFIGKNINALLNQTDLSNMVMHPAALGGAKGGTTVWSVVNNAASFRYNADPSFGPWVYGTHYVFTCRSWNPNNPQNKPDLYRAKGNSGAWNNNAVATYPAVGGQNYAYGITRFSNAAGQIAYGATDVRITNF